MPVTTSTPPDVAYYYPQPYWDMGEADAMKSLLLFFDRIAILLPRYMRGQEELADPVVASPLERLGLLEILEPETFVDQEVADELAALIEGLIKSGAFDGLDKTVYFHELSRSRMGWDADVDLAKGLIKDLKRKGLAEKSQDGESVPLHPVVRTAILVLLSQLARGRGRRLGIELHPVTGDRTAASGVLSTLSLPSTPSAGHVVALDLESVGVDLSLVPLDEVLAFRKSHGEEYRAYARDLRKLIGVLAALHQGERDRILADRREELADRANGLRKSALRAWQRIQPAATIGLGAIGAVWSASEGKLDWAALSLATGFVGAAVSTPVEAGAYTYLYSIRDSFSANYGRLGWSG